MSMKRSDGRSSTDAIRPLNIGLGVLEQADGSARLQAGKTEVLVAVHGPSQVKTRQEKTDRATIQVSIETLNTPPSSLTALKCPL